MAFWLATALQSASMSVSADTFHLAPARKPMTVTRLPGCSGEGDAADEVVVCGRKRDMYRLPLPTERDPLLGSGRGEPPSGVAALTPSGRCGIFAGERRCSKKEAADYGYGNGRDPITLITRLAQKAVDPDGN